MPGERIENIWLDIPSTAEPLQAAERLGYPTQKPLALLERIIETSGALNENDIVLDAFLRLRVLLWSQHKS